MWPECPGNVGDSALRHCRIRGTGGNVQNPQDPEWLLLHTRIAAELGADVIKTEYTGDTESMKRVVASCPIPILVLGGSRSGSDQEVLNLVGDIAGPGPPVCSFEEPFSDEEHSGVHGTHHIVLRGETRKKGR